MDLITGYAQTLRAIGQALETLNLGDFTVEPDGDSYRINGASLVVKNRCDPWTVNQPVVRATAMELSYSRSDVDRLEREGRTQRAENHGTADSCSIVTISACDRHLPNSKIFPYAASISQG